MNESVFRAGRFANKARRGKKREMTREPYIEHPLKVAKMIRAVCIKGDPKLLHTERMDDMLKAALLHEVLEDTPVTYFQLEERFGRKVARLVS